MKIKRLLSLLIAVVLCFVSVAVFAEDAAELVTVAAEEAADNQREEIAVASDEDDGIDYSDMSNWAYWREGEDKAADLFFVCPTVDMGKAGNLIADIENEKYRNNFVGATNMELGIYSEALRVYAPYYRQATFPVYSLSEEEREVYLDMAYQDIKDAFIYFADHTSPSRPLVLAGFSQGADLIIRLMKDLFDEPEYQRRLVAAYCIGWKLTEEEVKEYPHLMPAMEETDTGVIVAFNSEAPEVTSSLMIGENEKTYAINPLNWKTTSEVADKSLNKGACFTDYSGNIKEEIPALTGAYIDETRGALKVTDIDKEKYSSSMFDEGVYHLNDYQFFFRNLEENVKTRLSAYNEKYADRIDIYYDGKLMCFDVEPIIENGRTLVPFRAIFEVMGCVVNYTEDGGKQIVSARRGDDVLMLTIGENKMYFNGEEIALDVPAKIKDGRTLVPVRAISEAFECEVYWDGDTKTVDISSPAAYCAVSAEKLSETITDDDGNVLIEAIAYYPEFYGVEEIPYLEEINYDYKQDAEKFIEEARASKEDAELLREQMGENFTPFAYELTFEQTYNFSGYVSVTNYKYVNMGGAHPVTAMESRTFDMGLEEEMSVSTAIDEDSLEVSLSEYIINLFVEEFKEIAPELADEFNYDYVSEYIGYAQFYITKNSLVLYFNQGVAAPYALGVISVEIPYDEELFLVDMSQNCLDEYVFELEYDNGYEWQLFAYAEEKLSVSEEVEEYDPETLLSEDYPVGVKKITVKGIKKGYGALILAYVEKDSDIYSATKILIPGFYVDEDNKLTLVNESDGMFLIE